MGETDGQAPGSGVVTAGQIIKLSRGVIGDLVIIFHLVGDLGHTRTGDGSHVVVPPINAFARFAVIRRPAKIGRVDIGGQPLFKPVKLIWPNKMHLPAQAGLISRTSQMVRIGWNVGRELGGIVVDPAARRQQSRHETGAPRGTKRAGGIGVGKAGRTLRKRAQIWRMQPVGRAIGEKRAVQLIHHQNEDIGAGHVRPSCKVRSR